MTLFRSVLFWLVLAVLGAANHVAERMLSRPVTRPDVRSDDVPADDPAGASASIR